MSQVLEAVARHARETPDRLALSSPTRVYTYAGLAAEIERAALRLFSLQRLFRPGAPVAVQMENGPAWVVLDLALARLGWVSQPIGEGLPPASRDQALAASGAGVLLSLEGGVRSFEVAETRIRASLLRREPAALPPGTGRIAGCACLARAEMEAAALAQRDGIVPGHRHLPLLSPADPVETVAGLYATLLAGGRYLALPRSCVGLAGRGRPDLGRLSATILSERTTSLVLSPELLDGLVTVMDLTGLRLPELTRVGVTGGPLSEERRDAAGSVGLPARAEPGECAALGLLPPAPGPAAAPLRRLGAGLPV